MNTKLELTEKQKHAWNNLVKAVEECEGSGIEFITMDFSTFHAVNGKEIKVILEPQMFDDEKPDEIIRPEEDLPSVDIEAYNPPFSTIGIKFKH